MEWILGIFALVLLAVAGWILVYGKKQVGGSASNRVQGLSDKYSTDMNRFQARKEVKASTARRELAGTVGNEMVAVVGLNEGHKLAEVSEFNREQNLERLKRGLELETDEHRTLLVQNDLTTLLIGEASKQQMDVATYLELKKKVEMDRLDLDKQWQEAEQQLKAGFIFQLQAHQHLALMTEYIGKLYDRAKDLQEAGKDREYNLIEEHIEFMEGDFRGRQKRLVQASDEEDVQGSDENPETTGDD